jgi:hypothetical protein
MEERVMSIPLVSSFAELTLSLVSVFTQPSFQNFLTLLAGWVFCLGRHTITNLIVAAGAVEAKHFSCFHRFFSRAVWNFDSLGLVVFKLALRFVPEVLDPRRALRDQAELAEKDAAAAVLRARLELELA